MRFAWGVDPKEVPPNMRNRTPWALVALVVLGAAGTASAVDKKAAAPSGKSADVCSQDDATKTRNVLRELHVANQDEIKQSKAALDRAQSPEVKQFAERMLTDHTAADQKLTDLAKKKSIDLSAPETADPIHAAKKAAAEDASKALGDRKGTAYDAAYIGMEVGEHGFALRVVEQGQKSAKDADVKALLDDMHKTLGMHKDEAVRLSERVVYQPSNIGGGPAGVEHEKSNEPNKDQKKEEMNRKERPRDTLEHGTLPGDRTNRDYGGGPVEHQGKKDGGSVE